MSEPVVSPVVTGAARAACNLAAALKGPRLSILIFHRVLAMPDPLFPGEVDGARFERLMVAVASVFKVLPLSDAARRLADGSLPPRALSITFDDGYADNHDVALPILARLGLPATVFVATSFVDGGRMWNDTVIECIRRTSRQTIDFDRGELQGIPIGTVLERRAAIRRLLSGIKYLPSRERDDAVRDLHDACGKPELPETLMLSSRQVRELRAAGVEIGAHTIHHPILRLLDDADAEREIVESRRQLEAIADDRVSLFAYPNGQPGRDYEERHVAMVRRLGFTAAVTTAPGVSRTGDDVHQLKRFSPWDRASTRWLARLVGRHVRN